MPITKIYNSSLGQWLKTDANNAATLGGYSANVNAILNTIALRNANGNLYTNLTFGFTNGLITNNSGVFALRNTADTSYADLTVNNLNVKGTATFTETNTVNLGDNTIILNALLDSSTAPTTSAGLQVNRGSQTDSSLLWDEGSDSWKIGLLGSEKAIVLTDDSRLIPRKLYRGDATDTNYWVESSWISGQGWKLKSNNGSSDTQAGINNIIVDRAYTADSVLWTNVQSRPNALSAFTNDMAVARAGDTMTGTLTTPGIVLTGNIVNDGNERRFRANGTNINWGYFINGTAFGAYDWQSGREVFKYTPASNILQLMSTSGSVTTKGNTLDDGSGNIQASGYIRSNTSLRVNEGAAAAQPGAIQIGNAISSTNYTLIGTGGGSVSGVNGELLNIAENNIAWVMALDRYGNLGLNSTVSATVLKSIIGTGTAPLTVASTTLVSNLNVDMLDGNHASAFAPSGYGLGGLAKRLTSVDLNTVIANGWYDVQNPTNGVSGLSWHSLLVISSGDSNYVTQMVFPMTDGTEGGFYIRQRRSGTWQAWQPVWTGAQQGTGSYMNADMVDGLHADYASHPSTVVARDSNGYIYANYVHTDNGPEDGLGTSMYLFDDGDGWLRKKSLSAVRNEIVTGGFGIGGASMSCDGWDLNNLKYTGFWRGSNMGNAPNSGWFWITVQCHNDGSWVSQLAISYGASNSPNIIYSRVLANNVWTGWSVVGNSSDPTFNSITMRGDIITDGNERHFKSNNGNGWGVYINNSSCGMYDWVNGRCIISYEPSNAKLTLTGNGGIVASAHNILDDGNGNMGVPGTIWAGMNGAYGGVASYTLTLGDSDTGFNWTSDGNFNIMANSTCVGTVNQYDLSLLKQLWLNNSIYPQVIGDGSVLQLGESNSTASGVVIQQQVFRSALDNDSALGSQNHRWSTVYAASSAISTSDRNEKNTILSLDSDKTEQFIMTLNPVSYKFNTGTSDRTHYGMIAQDVEDEMTALGMTTQDFAGFIKSPKLEEYLDENGKKQTRVIEGEYVYGLRYEEFISPLIKTVQVLNNKIIDDNKRISDLESKVENLTTLINQLINK